MEVAAGVVIVAGESEVAVEVAHKFAPRAVRVVIVMSPNGSGAVGHLADAAEMVTGVIIVSGVGQ